MEHTIVIQIATSQDLYPPETEETFTQYVKENLMEYLGDNLYLETTVVVFPSSLEDAPDGGIEK